MVVEALMTLAESVQSGVQIDALQVPVMPWTITRVEDELIFIIRKGNPPVGPAETS